MHPKSALTQADDWRRECFARYCEQPRNEYCPNLVYDASGKKTRITWAQCFEQKYKQSLEDYRTGRYSRRPSAASDGRRDEGVLR